MPIYLRQSTASQEVPLGYFLDSTDGNTAETGLTIANTDIQVWKTGATTLANKNSGGATHISGGVYYCVLDATDTNTIGPLVIFCHPSGALAVRVECVVLDETVYDVLFGTTALSTYAGGAVASVTGAVGSVTGNVGGNVVGSVASVTATVNANVAQISGDSTAADNLESYCDGTTPIPANAIQISGDSTAADNCESYFDGTGYSDIDNLNIIRSNTAQAGASGSITLDAGASASDDFYNNTIVQIISGTGAGQARFISDYVGSTKVASVNGNWVTNPSSDSVFVLWPFGSIPGASAPTAGEIADAVWDEATSGHTTSGTFGEQVKTDIDAILVDTAEIGSAGAGLSAVPWNASWDAEVQSECTDALNAYDPPTNAELTAAVANVSVDEIQATALADLFNTDSGTTYASAVAGSVVAEIADNAGGSSLTVEDIRAEIDSNSTQLAAIVADTNELQTDWANGGRLDLILDARASQTSVDDLPTNSELSTALASADDAVLAAVAAVDTVVDAIKLVTDNLPDSGALTSLAQASDLATAITYIDTEIASILEDTGTTLPELINALNDLSAADVNAQVLDVLTTDTFAEVSMPAATASIKDMVHWVFTMTRNKITQTATTTLVRNDADSGNLATFTISDDSTTFTSGEGS